MHVIQLVQAKKKIKNSSGVMLLLVKAKKLQVDST